MARKSTTKAFRERAVAQVLAGKTEEQVAIELGVEVGKVRNWYKTATKAGMKVSTEMFDNPVQDDCNFQSESGPCSKVVLEKMKKLELENKCLRELVSLSTQWISTYMFMQSGSSISL